MWLKFEKETHQKFAYVSHRNTLGSARSNHIIVPGKGIRALQGQFLREQNSYLFKDFVSRNIFAIHESSSYELGEWRVFPISQENIEKALIMPLQEAFKKFSELEIHQNLGRDEIRARFLRTVFLNSAPPEQANSWIERFQAEISLESPIEFLLQDESITDILVNSFDEIYIEKFGRLQKSSYRFTSEENYKIYLENLLSRHELQYSPSQPSLSFSINEWTRAHLIGPPLSSGNFYLSLRRASESAWSLSTLIEKKLLSQEQAGLLQKYVRDGENILISGATGTGKTSLMKALILEIPKGERLVLLEDSPEISLRIPNLLILRSRSTASLEFSLQDLLKESLRMRPDRILIGEVRGSEAFDLLMALNTGHRGCISTLHANSARDALWRLQSLIRLHRNSLSEEAVRDLMARNINIVLHVGRDSNSKERKLFEIVRVRGVDGRQFLLESVDA